MRSNGLGSNHRTLAIVAGGSVVVSVAAEVVVVVLLSLVTTRQSWLKILQNRCGQSQRIGMRYHVANSYSVPDDSRSHKNVRSDVFTFETAEGGPEVSGL